MPPRFRTQQPLVEQAAELDGGKKSKLIRAALKGKGLKSDEQNIIKILILCNLLVDLK